MRKIFLSCLMLAASFTAGMAKQAEVLDRGVVAVKTTGGVLVSWRSLTTDSKALAFDVYRDGVKVNTAPVTGSTNFKDAAGTETSRYVVRAVMGSTVQDASKETPVWADGYLRLHLDRPAGGTTPSGEEYTYSPNDCSVGDIDGDGEYEIFVKWDPSNSHDNSENGYTGNVYIDCYKLDGTKMWRIDLGRNIRAGAHYTQFMVYDFDGDGKAEMACKTAPGTIDGQGKAVLMGTDKVTDDYRGTSGSHTTGTILKGSEYLTMFNGQTGAEISTVAYEPGRGVHSQSSGGWGDAYGNRSERYLACVAYLDGQKPSLVMCRGYYTHSYLCAWDFDGKQLTKRWLHASTTKGQGAYGEGAHSLTVGDVDGDGCDEIVYGSACIDHDGSLLYRTGAGHGDALHLGDFDPDREGLEVFMVHEEKSKTYKYDSEFRDAKTGEIIWCTAQSGNDIGRGLVGNISPNWRGYEIWPGSYFENGTKLDATFDCKGNLLVNKRASTNFRIYWDGDLLDELFDGRYNSTSKTSAPEITKRNAALTSNANTWTFNKYDNAQSCNTTKATPNLIADILGDWREELILWDGNTSSDLLIFTTGIETKYKVPCLMQDHNYRMAIAWQNVAYNQPPHLGYYLEDAFSTDAKIKNISGATTQTIELGDEIEKIVYEYDKATGATVTGLPDGVTASVNTTDNTVTISGTPAATGAYKYVVTTTGGETTATAEGTINVRDKVVLTPLACFPFDEVGSSTTNTVYGQATATGNPVAAEGKKNGALSLDGTAYYTQEAYDKLQLGTKDFTIEMWFKSTDDAAYLLHKGSMAANTTTGATGKWFGIEYKGGNLKFAIDDNVTKSEAMAPASAYFNGEWNHLVCVRDSYTKTLRMYVNGVLVAESADNTGDISDNNELFVIGNVNVGFNNTFAGVMDELTIFEGAMTAKTVAERYNSLASGIGSVVAGRATSLTVVSATTGMVVRRGIGAEENVTAGLPAGYYILVKDNGMEREVRKVVVR